MRLRKAVEAEPDKAELKLDLALALLATGGAHEAEQLLDALPANLATDDRAIRARARLGFAALLQDAPPAEVLEAAIASNPDDLRARHLLGVHRIVAGDAEAGLEQFIEMLRRNRDFDGGLPRKALIDAFRDRRGRGPGRPLPPQDVVAAAGLNHAQASRRGRLRHALNLWPPFLFTGIHVSDIADDFRHARVELRMRPWNRNYVGTHFGGSLFAMTDPFWMLLVLHAIGDDYIVWDQAGAIEFDQARARHRACASSGSTTPSLDELRAATAGGDKVLRWFDTDDPSTPTATWSRACASSSTCGASRDRSAARQ